MRNARTFVASFACTVTLVTGALGALGLGIGSSDAADPIVTFQSPSGNAHCMIITEPGSTRSAACEIREFTGKPPARPADCDLDWVPGASVDSRGRVSLFGCQGDTMQNPNNQKLAYGKSIKSGEFTCTSAVTGITCKVKSGRGFLVSRAIIKKI